MLPFDDYIHTAHRPSAGSHTWLIAGGELELCRDAAIAELEMLTDQLCSRGRRAM
ncbi:MAG TPA: hypothetical protein VIX73_11875 [Kofleriaceae bacterium]|jgi:hypothetical protein